MQNQPGFQPTDRVNQNPKQGVPVATSVVSLNKNLTLFFQMLKVLVVALICWIIFSGNLSIRFLETIFTSKAAIAVPINF